ncbi:MAG: response regulator [Alphaproteobacteria bacterium]|nr:response regulator [Alphaproteobacteria bacterium SS10]
MDVVYDLRPLSILLVEDSPFMRELMTTLLESLEVGNITTTPNGEDAMSELMLSTNNGIDSNSSYDVIISDWAMKPMSGLDLLKWVRSHDNEGIQFMPFIMLTAYSSADWVCEARDWGATEFLTKPVSAQAVARRLLNVIERPRPFIRTGDYFGPDRRRQKIDFSGQERRKAR